MSDTELRRRLTSIADLARVDDDEAWERLQRRLAEPAPALVPRSRRTPPKLLLIAAAAAVAVLGTFVLARKSDDGGVRTVDDDTTTTTIEDRPSTTSTSTSTTSSTTVVPTGPGSVPGETPGSPSGGESPGTVTNPPGSTPSTSAVTTPPPVTVPGGELVRVTFTASGYTLQGTFEDVGSGRFEMDIWRAGQGEVGQLLLFNRPGQNCLAGGNPTDFAFPEAGGDIYTWGLVRADAARVRIVTTDAQTTNAVLGAEAYPGVRVWIGRIPNDQIDRLEALDGSGGILHDALWGANLDAYPDSC